MQFILNEKEYVLNTLKTGYYGESITRTLDLLAQYYYQYCGYRKVTVSQSHNITFGDTNINIDKVEDYNDFVTKLREDSQFEKMILSMTVDRIAGGSSLKKHKYKWKKENGRYV